MVNGDDTQSARRINWIKVCAAVLTSKLFFLASCTGGMFLGNSLQDRIESPVLLDQAGMVHTQRTRAAIIAVIPNADEPGEREIVMKLLENLEQFKQDHPDYSFVPPLGKGVVDWPHADMPTEYMVTTTGPGKVMVETEFFHDVPPFGAWRKARYEATDKEIKSLYVKLYSYEKTTPSFLYGFSLAIVLALAGSIIKWRFITST